MDQKMDSKDVPEAKPVDVSYVDVAAASAFIPSTADMQVSGSAFMRVGESLSGNATQEELPLVPPPSRDASTEYIQRIDQAKANATKQRETFLNCKPMMADAIGAPDADALFQEIAEDPAGFINDKRRLVREAAHAQAAFLTSQQEMDESGG